MEIFVGRVWKFGDNINTDLMLPNIAATLPESEQPKYCFWANRPGWAENEVKPGDIIVAGKNFGTGSGRQGARIFKALGLPCILADSINGLFFRNCVNLGMPAMQCPGVSEAFEEGDEAEVDMVKGTVHNKRTGVSLNGEAIPDSLLQMMESGGILPLLRREGYIK